MTEPVRKSVPMADGAVSYLDWQGEGPRLHFTHANGFNAETYKSLLTPLSGRFRITAGDQRGHGFSTLATPDGFAKAWTQFRDDLICLLEGLGDGPMLLAGHSMGGVASLMVAVERPELVSGLVLIEPVFLPAHASNMPRSMQEAGSVAPTLVERAAKRRDVFESTDAIEASYRGRGAFKYWPDEMLHDYVMGGTLPTEDGRVRLACSPKVEAACFAATPHGAYRIADAVHCPVTLIHGDGPDSTCQPAQAREFARLKPDAHVVAVKGTGHFLPMEMPDIVRDEINRIGDRR